jgi:hypothetical protein
MSQRVNARVWNANISFARQEKFKTHPTVGKFVLAVFFLGGGITGAITGTLSREGSTVNSARYSKMLCEKLKLAIRRKKAD